MARMARAVAPGVTQRGNRRQQTFFNDEDYQSYLELMAQWCEKYKVEIWSYCLMPNHVHLIAVPETKDGLKLAIGEAHRRYTRRINFREGWRGHLWQGRFSSFMMDERYLANTMIDLFTGRLAYIISALCTASIPIKVKEDTMHKTIVIPLIKPMIIPPKSSTIVHIEIMIRKGIIIEIPNKKIPPAIKSFFIRSNMIPAPINLF